MSNVPTLRRCALLALLASCLAGFGGVAQAQSAAMTIPDSAAMPVPLNDWHILSDPAYSYSDLRLAHLLGYTDTQRATIAKIARLTGLPFKLILNQVHEGRTFAWLASDYGLRLSDVLDASDEKARIDEYLSLYQMLHSYGEAESYVTTSASADTDATLTGLEARFGELNAAFPPLPPTNIETTPIGSAQETVTQLPPAPIATAPVPTAAPMQTVTQVQSIRTITVIHTVHHVRHHRRHRRHRHMKPAYMRHMGS